LKIHLPGFSSEDAREVFDYKKTSESVNMTQFNETSSERLVLPAVMVAMIMLLSAFVGNTVMGHHAPALYDSDRMMAIEGKLVLYQHHAPHARMTLEIEGSEGEVSTWIVSMPPPQAINRKGFTDRLNSLKAGDSVRVRGWPHFVNDNELRSYKVYLEGDEMLQMVYNNNFKHKDQIRLEEYLDKAEALGEGSDQNMSAQARIAAWVEEDDFVRRVAIEYNAGQAAFVGVPGDAGTVFPGIEDHLACLPERLGTIALTVDNLAWTSTESVAAYITSYNDMLARHNETSQVTCGE
jgi:hypothetical protein